MREEKVGTDFELEIQDRWHLRMTGGGRGARTKREGEGGGGRRVGV